jgi:hypothetical protein
MHKKYWQQKHESGRLLDFYQACSELFTNMELSGKHPGGVPDYPGYLLKRLEENEQNRLVVRRTKTRSASRPQEYVALLGTKQYIFCIRAQKAILSRAQRHYQTHLKAT